MQQWRFGPLITNPIFRPIQAEQRCQAAQEGE